jgi:hypothetical protein
MKVNGSVVEGVGYRAIVCASGIGFNRQPEHTTYRHHVFSVPAYTVLKQRATLVGRQYCPLVDYISVSLSTSAHQ